MQAEVFEGLRELGVAEDKAMRVARALCTADGDITDLKADVGILQADVSATMAYVAVPKPDSVLKANLDSIRADLATIRANNRCIIAMSGMILGLRLGKNSTAPAIRRGFSALRCSRPKTSFRSGARKPTPDGAKRRLWLGAANSCPASLLIPIVLKLYFG
jgi:hypothetical protein